MSNRKILVISLTTALFLLAPMLPLHAVCEVCEGNWFSGPGGTPIPVVYCMTTPPGPSPAFQQCRVYYEGTTMTCEMSSPCTYQMV